MITVPKVETLIHSSEVLKGNPIGNVAERCLPVYLPPNYDAKRKDPYPVVFFLSGWGGRGAHYLKDEGAFTPSLPEKFDEMILAEELPSFVGVFPDGATKLGHSQYVNSESNGRFMDYVCDELVEFVDEKFHTFGEGQKRAVVGHSSGGFGALAIGMKRPDRFSLVCSSAGDSWYEYVYVQCIPTMIDVLEKAGGVQKFIQTFMKSPNPLGLSPRSQGETMMILSLSTCYAPNPNVPLLMGDVHFDLKTGELIPEVWEKFLNWDPVHMVKDHVDALKKLRWIYLESGKQDEYGLHLGHRQLAKRLSQYEIDHEIEEYSGKHGGHHYRMASRVKKLLSKMK